jgi:hypothetical protein
VVFGLYSQPYTIEAGVEIMLERRELIRGAYGLVISVVLVPAVLAYLQMSAPVVILGAICSIVLLAAIDNWAFIWRQSGVLAGLILIAASLGFAYWYKSNITTNGWWWHFHVSFPISATNTPPPPLSAPPWVTQDEIDAQLKLGRNLLVFSPEELIGKWISTQNVSIYLTNWIKINYPIIDSPTPIPLDKKDYDLVEMQVKSHRLLGIAAVLAYFDPKKWNGRLLALRAKDYVKAYCQLKSIQQGEPGPSPYSIRPDILIAVDCDFI